MARQNKDCCKNCFYGSSESSSKNGMVLCVIDGEDNGEHVPEKEKCMRYAPANRFRVKKNEEED